MLLGLSLLFVVRLYYGPACVAEWETDKVHFKMGYIQFIDKNTGNEVYMMGTWTVEDIKNKRQ